jgi:hypothetical protein
VSYGPVSFHEPLRMRVVRTGFAFMRGCAPQCGIGSLDSICGIPPTIVPLNARSRPRTGFGSRTYCARRGGRILPLRARRFT